MPGACSCRPTTGGCSGRRSRCRRWLVWQHWHVDTGAATGARPCPRPSVAGLEASASSWSRRRFTCPAASIRGRVRVRSGNAGSWRSRYSWSSASPRCLQMIRAGWPRFIVNTMIVVSIWWNLGLIAQFATGLMDRNRMEPARNAYNNFVTIPAGSSPRLPIATCSIGSPSTSPEHPRRIDRRPMTQ